MGMATPNDLDTTTTTRISLPNGTFVRVKTADLPPLPMRGIPTPAERRAYLNKRKRFLARKKAAG